MGEDRGRKNRDENSYPRIDIVHPTRFYFIAIFRSFVDQERRIYRHRSHRTNLNITVDKDWINLLFTIVESGITDTIIISPSPFLLIVTYCLSFPSPPFLKGKFTSLRIQFLTWCIINGNN